MVVGRCQPKLLEAAISGVAPVLALVPDETAVEELHEHWRHSWPEQLRVAEQLVGAEPGEQAWFHYNDPRHNGVTPPETLQRTCPNLKLQHLELREQITLSQALQGWPAAEAEGGTLLLIDSVAEALQGPCSSELKGLKRLLWLPAQEEPMPEQLAKLDQQLRMSWLARDPAASAAEGLVVWEHDPRLQFEATVLAERDQLAALRDSLTSERDQLSAHRDQLTTERDQLTAERDQLAALRDSLTSERDQLSAHRDQLTAERDQLAALRDSLTSERDSLTSERDQLAGERDGLQQRMEAINRELDDILTLMDEAMPETAVE